MAFAYLANGHGFDRVHVRFGKPVSEGFRVKAFKGDQRLLRFEVEDGVVEDVEYGTERRDRFDDKGRVDRIVLRGDRRTLLKRKGDDWELQTVLGRDVDFSQLSVRFDPAPGELSAPVKGLADLFGRSDLRQFDFEKEKVVFQHNLDTVSVQIGTGKKAKRFSFEL